MYFLLIVVLIFALPQPSARAQAQSGSDSSTGSTNQSWTATTQQQLPSNQNPTRTSETRTESGGRTIDDQSMQAMGTDGRYDPYLDVQKETVKVDATTTRTVERTFGRDSEGRKTLV